MTTLLTLTLSFAALVYVGLLALTFLRLRQRHPSYVRFAGLVALLLLATLAYLFLPPVGVVGGAGGAVLGLALLISGLAALGALLLDDLRAATEKRWLWWGGHALWGIALLIVSALSPSAAVGAPNWTTDSAPDLSVAVAGVGWLVAGGGLLALLLRVFYRAHLPEVASRAMYWVMCVTLYLSAMVLLASGSPAVMIVGVLGLLAAIVGIYTNLRYHAVFDVRMGVRRAVSGVGITLTMGAVVLAALYAADALPDRDPLERVILLMVVALALAFAFLPIRQGIEALIGQVIRERHVDPAQVTREYSRQVSQAVDLNEIVAAATNTLNSIMRISQSGIMLVNNTAGLDGDVELLVTGASLEGVLPQRTMRLSLNSPVYTRLAVEQSPVSQFDLEFNPRYASMTRAEREFFHHCRMHAYAPIVMDNVMIGVLLCGGKVDDSIYHPSDLIMLATIAQQIGFALRNARLVADLRHLNTSMRSLNRGLEEANKELAKLDSVKSDFVTIASHELRTPLAQIRGYTDMIDAINESGMLEQAQVSSMVMNLRKASERMEELIGAMLDVSQLDVNALDLRFAPTTPEAVLRMAIEPLTNEIRQRKLNLTARWKGLPAIQADLQRLVQAFRNIVVNAIKFTPDGGQIEITATLQPATRPGEVDHILVAISDTGVGIDRENLELIFRKFYRTYDPSLHSTGTYKFLGAGPGLGLTIAKGVIEAHGGRIWAESERHSMQDLPGTTIYVSLPVSQSGEDKRALKFDDSAAG